MEVLILICGIVLILMSLVLLLLSPAAVLGIIAGVLVVILRKKFASNFKSSSAKSKEIFQEEMKHRRAEHEEKNRIKREAKAAAEVKRIQAEEAEQKARQIHLTLDFALHNVSKDVLSKYKSTQNEMSQELRYLYDRGERIFRDNYDFTSANVDFSNFAVVVDDNILGYLNPACFDDISQIQSQCLKSWFEFDVCYGYYAKIVRNPDYNREIDDDYDKNYVEYSTLKTPEVTLRLHYYTERSYS